MINTHHLICKGRVWYCLDETHCEDEVIQTLKRIPDLSSFGTLSDEAGIKTITDLPKVDIVLIGTMYNDNQRTSMKKFVNEHHPNVKVTEPGIDYPDDETLIIQTVKKDSLVKQSLKHKTIVMMSLAIYPISNELFTKFCKWKNSLPL